MRQSSVKVVSIFTTILPYAFLAGSVAVFLFLLLLGRSDIAFKSLYLLIPISIAALIILIKPGWFMTDTVTSLPGLSPVFFQNLVLLTFLLNIVSVCLLFFDNTYLSVYYIFIGLISSVIFLEIIAYGDEAHPGRKGMILFQIVFVSANVILGQTLRLPLFFGYGDVLAHMYNISSIAETGRVTSAMLYDYQHFPGFHLFGVIGNILSGLDLETSYFIFNSLVFLISIPVVYLLVSRLTKNRYLPLLSALIYAFSREVLFNGMYMITRVMAFVLCFLILYLLIRSRADLKIRALAVFLVFPLVLVHHTTLLHFSGILAIIILLELVLYRRQEYIGMNFLVLFIVAYLGYWAWIGFPFLKNTLNDFFISQSIMQVPVQSSERSLLFVFTNNADVIVIAFLAIIGIISLLRARREPFVMGTAFVIFSIMSLLLYSPAVSSFFSKILLSGRLQLLVTPFIAFVSAGGLLLVAGKSLAARSYLEPILRIVAGMIIVFFLSLSSTVILANSTDFNHQKLLGIENRQYFTESELAAFSFAQDYGRYVIYYGDYASSVYINKRLGLTVRNTVDIFQPELIGKGSLIFRKQELQTRGRLGFTIWGEEGSGDQEYTYLTDESPDIQALWENENKIFDGGTTYIYARRTP